MASSIVDGSGDLGDMDCSEKSSAPARGNEAMAPGRTPSERPARSNTKSDDWDIFLTYIEDPRNFEKLFFTSRRTQIGARFVKKGAAWDLAAAELRILGFPKTTGKNLTKRFQRKIAKYKEARRLSLKTGWGLSNEERELGMTLEEKLDAVCEYYERINELFGGRVNIDPPAESGPMGFQGMVEDAPPFVPSSQPAPRTGDDISLAEDGERTPDWVREQHQAISEEVGDFSDDFLPIEPIEDEFGAELPEPQHDNGLGEGIDGIDGALVIPPQANDTPEPPPVRSAQENTTPPAPPISTSQAEATPQPPSGNTTRSTARRSTTRPVTSSTPRNGGASKTNPPAASKKATPDSDKGKGVFNSKPTLAQVFQESKVQEAEFKVQYMEKKGLWKMAELEDRRQARHDEHLKRKFELEFEANERRMERAEKLKDAKLQRKFEGKRGASRNKMELIMAGWAQNRKQDEIESFLGKFVQSEEEPPTAHS